MEKPIKRMDELRIVPDAHPVIDISYVELPERLTRRINLSNILGTVSFLAMLAAPGAMEGENYILALALTALCWICAQLAMAEDGKGGRAE